MMDSNIIIMLTACFIEDAGGPFEFCFQEWGSNHLMAAPVRSWGGERQKKRHSIKCQMSLVKADAYEEQGWSSSQ